MLIVENTGGPKRPPVAPGRVPRKHSIYLMTLTVLFAMTWTVMRSC